LQTRSRGNSKLNTKVKERDSRQNGFFELIFLPNKNFSPPAFEEHLFSVACQVTTVTAKRAFLDPRTVTMTISVFLHEDLSVVQEMTVRQIIKESIMV